MKTYTIHASKANVNGKLRTVYSVLSPNGAKCLITFSRSGKARYETTNREQAVNISRELEYNANLRSVDLSKATQYSKATFAERKKAQKKHLRTYAKQIREFSGMDDLKFTHRISGLRVETLVHR